MEPSVKSSTILGAHLDSANAVAFRHYQSVGVHLFNAGVQLQ